MALLGRLGASAAGGAAIAVAVAVEVLLRLRPDWLPPAVQQDTGRHAPDWNGIVHFRQRWQTLLQPDPWLGYRYRPNLDVMLAGHPEFAFRLRTNARGFRTRFERGPVDVVLVGDSFAFGHGVEERDAMGAVLERLSGRSVANLGVGGYGSLQELRLLEREGLRLRPQVIVWQLFKDDLWGAAEFMDWLESGRQDMVAWKQARWAEPHPLRAVHGPASGVRRILHRHLIGYELIKYVFALGGYRARDRRPVRVRWGSTVLVLDRASDSEWADLTRPEIQDGWIATRRAVRRARELAVEKGACLVVAYVPSKEEVYGHLRPGKDRRGVSRLVGERLATLCRQVDVPFLDLLDGLARAARSGDWPYFSRDSHWSAAGHAVAAAELYRFLEVQGLLCCDSAPER